MARRKIDWYKYITAKLLDKDTAISAEEADAAAKDWTLCACGSQEPILRSPTNDNEPWDDELNTLGCKFYDDISSENYPQALVTLLKIQDRATTLLRALRRYSPAFIKSLRDPNYYGEKDTERIAKFYDKVGGEHALV